ncbi:MAG: metalloregulator ArsR/SmtB family transcription factor [Vulcanimicrobiaceae bacterium]
MSIQRCSPEVAVYRAGFEVETALFKALAEPARLVILATLARAESEVCVCDFTCGLGLNQSTVSHHLKLLKEAGLVTSVRRGTWGYYSLEPGARSALETALGAILPVRVLA